MKSVVILVTVCLLQTTVHAEKEKAPEKELRRRFEAIMDVFNEADSSQFDDYFAQDIEIWPPRGPAVVGLTAVYAELAENTFEDLGTIRSYDNVRVTVLAEGWGCVTSTFQTDNDEEYKMLMVWRIEDGKWLLMRDLWSPNTE